jgi:hypothetical protein
MLMRTGRCLVSEGMLRNLQIKRPKCTEEVRYINNHPSPTQAQRDNK